MAEISALGSMPGFHGYAAAGKIDAITTRIPLALARSAIAIKLSSMEVGVVGPVLPAISFVPARITTTFGCSAITSGQKRTNICGVVWPLMPRFTYGLPGKNTPVGCPQRVCDGIAHEHHSLHIWEPERPIAHSPRCISPDRRSRSAIARHAFVDTRFQAVSPVPPGWQFEAPWQASEWFVQRRREPAGSSYREVSCSHPFDVAYSSVCIRTNSFSLKTPTLARGILQSTAVPRQ